MACWQDLSAFQYTCLPWMEGENGPREGEGWATTRLSRDRCGTEPGRPRSSPSASPAWRCASIGRMGRAGYVRRWRVSELLSEWGGHGIRDTAACACELLDGNGVHGRLRGCSRQGRGRRAASTARCSACGERQGAGSAGVGTGCRLAGRSSDAGIQCAARSDLDRQVTGGSSSVPSGRRLGRSVQLDPAQGSCQAGDWLREGRPRSVHGAGLAYTKRGRQDDQAGADRNALL